MSLFINSSLMNINLHILHAEHSCVGNEWYAKNISSPFSRVYIVSEGSGKLTFPEGSVDMRAGFVYVIPAGLPFSCECTHSVTFDFFHISVPTPNGYDLMERLSHHIEFSDEAAVSAMSSLIKQKTLDKLFEIKSYLYQVLSRCSEEIDNADIQKHSAFVSDVMNYIDNNLSFSLTTESIAMNLLVSAAKIRKVFRNETGVPIGRYIRDRVLLSAEVKLRCTALSVKEISDSLGFVDQFYFSRCFSKKYGLSPSKYRAQCLI